VQSLPTEAKPLSACSQCGTALPAPTGSATFVYGVGAVGYQSCDTCGAKWRYLWKDPPGTGGGLNRLPFLLVGAVIVALLVVGVFGALRSPSTYKAAAESPTTTTSKPRDVTTTTPVPRADVNDFQAIINPLDTQRTALLTYLETTAQSAPQFVVNQRAAAFVNQANQATDALKRASWPPSVLPDIDRLVAMQQQFTSDLDLIQYGLLYSPSFTQKLESDVATIRDAESAVRRDLGVQSSSK
jgi:hypothetical protein